MKEIRVKFLKKRFYRGKQYNIGDIENILSNDLQAYLDCKVVKVLGADKTKNKNIDYNNFSYKELQKMCKNKNIPAVGKRNELIASLNNI